MIYKFIYLLIQKIMRLLKSNKVLSIVNSYIVDSPQPSNISYMWNFGSLLATCLGIQIVTGVILAMHYTPNVDLAFISVEHIMRDVNYGWMIRYLHANTASFFFIFVYLHIARGMYYGSYKSPRILPWSIGVIILVLMMGTAFLGYVLPYGQMSLWGATVITNMLSAIPWIGQDFVQLTILLLVQSFIIYLLIVNSINTLPTIGKVNTKALRGKKARTENDKAPYKNIPFKFIAMFRGIVDGDGYIKCTKTSKGYISMELVILLDIRDRELLEYLKSVLLVGRTYYYDNTVKYIIGRVDLQEVVFPLLLNYNIQFLTDTRREQFRLALSVLIKNIVHFKDLENLPKTLEGLELPTTPIGYLNLPYFNNWVVGFTITEGSFLIKSSGELFFNLTQRSHDILFGALKLLFGTTRKIDKSFTGNSKLSISSVKDLNNVVKYFSFSDLHPLLGYKKLQYDQWLKTMRNLPRFKNVKLPENIK